MQNDELTLAVLRHTESIRTQKSLAEELGYSVGKINYVLKALIAKGFIKAENLLPVQQKAISVLLTEQGIKGKG